MDQTPVDLDLLLLAGGKGAHQPLGLLGLLRVGDGEDGEGAVPAPGHDGPGGGGEACGLAGQGVVGDHGGVVPPEQSDRVPTTVVIPHVLLSLSETYKHQSRPGSPS